MFCRSLFVLLYFFFWPLCCLFLLDLRFLITPLQTLLTVSDYPSSNSSYGFWLPLFKLFLRFLITPLQTLLTDSDYPSSNSSYGFWLPLSSYGFWLPLFKLFLTLHMQLSVLYLTRIVWRKHGVIRIRKSGKIYSAVQIFLKANIIDPILKQR